MELITLPCEVICLNDEGRPNEIPISQWPVKGQIYTATEVMTMVMYNNVPAIKIEGFNPPLPYVGYLANRFVFIVEMEEEEDPADWWKKTPIE